jgi:hypothetical protein
LMEGHDTRHTATIFGDPGVIANEDGSPHHDDGLLLTPNQGPPTREQSRQSLC